MITAGVLPLGFASPFAPLIQAFISLFATDDDKDDEKDVDDGKIVDDLDDEDDDSLFGKDKDDEDDKDEDDSKEKDKSKKDSAIVQKQKYRDLYKKTSKELADAKAKLDEKDKEKGGDDAKAKSEREARAYIRGLIDEVLTERTSKDEQTQKELDEQMEELLEDNDDLTEKQVLDVVEELGVTPKQAVAAIRREQKAGGEGKKAKPRVPRGKGGGGEHVDDEKEKKAAPLTLEQASALAKKKLREMGSR